MWNWLSKAVIIMTIKDTPGFVLFYLKLVGTS